ncbi:MAG: SCO family protein [Rhodospirillales bacterium]
MDQDKPRSKLRTVRYALWGLVILAAAVSAYLAVSGNRQSADDGAISSKEAMRSSIKADFELVDHQGALVTEESYRGSYMLVFFGFTNCPDVCPTTLSKIAQVMTLLGTAAEKVKPLFITVDPERDTPERMAEYVAAFDERIVGLSGTPEQVKTAADSFKIYFAKVDQDGAPDGYTMDHTAYTYLFNAAGEFEEFFSDHDEATNIAARIQGYITP